MVSRVATVAEEHSKLNQGYERLEAEDLIHWLIFLD